ncbi:unnamed protein product [Coregonus sp. 'balchen']|nr:unnamed protein product [Coregonus sp. 'balchen']
MEAEAVMLGQPISMVLPEVIGYRLQGTPDKFITSTDIVLTVTKHLRQIGVVEKFVEFFGPGVAQLSIADRAQIANVPRVWSHCSLLPVDYISVQYLEQTGRDAEKLDDITRYLKAVAMFRDYSNSSQDPDFTQEASQISIQVSRRDHVRGAPTSFSNSVDMSLQQGFKGFQVAPERHHAEVPFQSPGEEAGLSMKPYIKTSLSPGSGVVTYYLKESGVMDYLFQLGFEVVGYGCMTCIGNSNRNFEGRVHPNTQANYLASPPLVIAYAIAGTVRIDFDKEPIDKLYTWNPMSTYIKSPPFFDGLFLNNQAPRTLHLPSDETLDVFDAAECYQQAGFPLMILAGKEYGSGSSRDWASKGPFLLGIKAVLAESYEMIHRSNLVGMGVIPLEYLAGDTADSLDMTGRERHTVVIPEPLTPKMIVDIKVPQHGQTFQARMRFDTDVELTYFHNGGILNYKIRKMSEN